MNNSKELLQQIASLLIYSSVFKSEIGISFINLLKKLSKYAESEKTNRPSSLNLLQAYGHWFKLLATTNKSWQDYLTTRILQDDNPFSRQIQQVPIDRLPLSLIIAVKQDLRTLQNIYNCHTQEVSDLVQQISSSKVKISDWNLENSANTFLQSEQNWADTLADLASYYRQHGTGIMAQYRALRWQKSQFIGILHPDPIQLKEIIGYESQKKAVIKNTEFLLAGYPALHVLLYGSRGSGKSSLVKALLSEYGDRGLRLIEVSKSELKDLPIIVEQLRDLSQKFIIFVDDLSFEEDDDAFKALKVVLEGSLTARANNIVVYATSNRRHLIREFFSDRPRPSDADEIHSWDNVQEKLSFSDRFGLTLTFEPANQNTYLSIVNALAQQAGIAIDKTELEFRAKQWATRGNGRSGRTARQFIDYLRAELA